MVLFSGRNWKFQMLFTAGFVMSKERILMAVSKCMKCGGAAFEIVDGELQGSKSKLKFVQCASCGGVVGVTEPYNIGDRLGDLAKALGVRIPGMEF